MRKHIALILILTANLLASTTNINFDSGNLDNWKIVNGNWNINKGKLQIDAANEQATILFGSAKWQNYIIEADITFDKITRDDCWASIAFRAAQDGNTVSHCYIKPKTSKENACGFIVRKNNRWSGRDTAKPKDDFQLGKSRRLRVVIRGNKMQTYLDDADIFSSNFCVDSNSGLVGLGLYGCKIRFDNFSITNLPNSKARKIINNADYLIISHRGYSAKFPENTISAIEGGIQAGSNGIEFDIHKCASGEIVVIHDATLDRTTNGEGKVSETSLTNIQKLDAGFWKDEKFAGEKIPTLNNALDSFEGNLATAVIEIKDSNIDARNLAKLIKLHNVDFCVIAFSSDKIVELKSADKSLRCGLLVGNIPEGNSPAFWLAQKAKELSCEVLSINYKILDQDIISTLKKQNVEVWAWTVNDISVMQTLINWGIDGITTDIAEARKLLNDKD